MTLEGMSQQDQEKVLGVDPTKETRQVVASIPLLPAPPAPLPPHLRKYQVQWPPSLSSLRDLTHPLSLVA
jgi:hypothetical protein